MNPVVHQIVERIKESPSAMTYARHLLDRINDGVSDNCSWNAGYPRNRVRPSYERLADLAEYADRGEVIKTWHHQGDDASLRTFWLAVSAQLTNPTDALSTQQEKHPVKLLETKTLVNGTDIKTLDDDGLINAIKRLEAEKNDLGSVNAQSKKIATKQAEIDKAIDVVVAELDSRS